jgi:SAM-dependent methyltransferase
VYGFDVSRETIEQAQKSNQITSVVFQSASATDLPMEAKSADVFVSLETIEHIDDDQSFLDQVVRIVKDDGLFICSTPDRDVHSPGNTPLDQPWTPFHIREYSADEFARMLNDRFRSVRFFGQNPALVGATRAKCWMGRTISKRLVLRITQVEKLGWLLGLRRGRHDVVPVTSSRRYEYLVAVCSDVVRTDS